MEEFLAEGRGLDLLLLGGQGLGQSISLFFPLGLAFLSLGSREAFRLLLGSRFGGSLVVQGLTESMSSTLLPHI